MRKQRHQGMGVFLLLSVSFPMVSPRVLPAFLIMFISTHSLPLFVAVMYYVHSTYTLRELFLLIHKK